MLAEANLQHCKTESRCKKKCQASKSNQSNDSRRFEFHIHSLKT